MTKATFGRKLAGAGLALLSLTIVLSYSSLAVIRQLGSHLNRATTETATIIDLIGEVKSNFYQLQGETKRVQFAYVVEKTTVDANLAMKLGECKGCHASDSSTAQAGRNTAAMLIGNVKRLRTLVHDTASQTTLGELEAGTRRLQQFQTEYLAAVGRNEFADAHEVLTEKIDPLLTQLQENTSALERSQNSVLAASAAIAGEQISMASRTVWIVIVLCIVVLSATFRLIHRSIRQLVGNAGKLSEHASDVARTAAGVSTSGDEVAQHAVSQANAIDSTSQSTDCVKEAAHRNLESADEVARLATQVGEHVKGANRSLNQLSVAMDDIDASSHQISRIMKVINEIASQTNILSLNAAVEAARSGDAGLGFAVVADEVRSLAQRCAEAARDSEQLIQSSVAKARVGRERVQEVSDFVRSVTTDVTAVTEIAVKLHEGSTEQATNIDAMSRSIREIRANTHEFATAAEESAAAGQTLSRQARDMNTVVDEMTGMIGGNLNR